MMIVQIDKMSAPSSRERAQRLYEKNIELESKRRKSAQARIPSDPNAWPQMRENYEAIILEDHAFSEQHNIEYALWQLHYRRIEELRASFSAALTSTGSNATQGANAPARRIRLQFKTFLSEATGFYHDLILKIRAKYGLPLGYFSEDSDNRSGMDEDGKKSADVKKALMSCHRCLIYLGDLARYKGVYGESESKTREFAAASSYYLQAASLFPATGNPHHQLAILASYSGDEFVLVYRYFRSLAVDSPFATARDNLIVAFEKNRQSYSQLLGDANASPAKELPGCLTGRARGKREVNGASSSEANVAREGRSNIPETFKSFCTRFVRLNGILFTRTSLETFPEVLTSVSRGFSDLLSSGPQEELNFGADFVENRLFIVRLIAILIFTVHNVKKEVDGQTYAEIVQRAVLLQNAFTAVFELVGFILERCAQLQDPSSSYLLPGILVFVEWLACCPDVASGSDANEKQGTVRSNFWNHCISFLNNILSHCSMSLDDSEEDTCFVSMSPYDEGETQNRLALWEDFELRGYLPLLPAQTILDFSRKHSFGSDGSREKVARVKRILAAGKALANMVRVDQKTIEFDSKAKKFVIGAEPRVPEAFTLDVNGDSPVVNDVVQEIPTDKTQNLGVLHSNRQLYVEEGEEEDEVIVFKPAVTEKQNDVISPNWPLYDGLRSSQNASACDLQSYGAPISVPLDNLQCQTAIDLVPATPTSASNQQLQPIQLSTSKWLGDGSSSLANSLKAVRFMENGHAHSVTRPVSVQPSVNMHVGVVPSGVIPETLAARTSAPVPVALRKSPVSRPVWHLGPPPGFSPVPPRQVNERLSGSEFTSENPLGDNYGWLDGYQLPSSAIGSALNGSAHFPSHASPQFVGTSADLTGTAGFPFPGKQVPPVQLQAEKQNGWQNFQALEQLRVHHEQQLQQQLINGNQQFTPKPEQYHGQSIWGGRFIV